MDVTTKTFFLKLIDAIQKKNQCTVYEATAVAKDRVKRIIEKYN